MEEMREYVFELPAKSPISGLKSCKGPTISFDLMTTRLDQASSRTHTMVSYQRALFPKNSRVFPIPTYKSAYLPLKNPVNPTHLPVPL